MEITIAVCSLAVCWSLWCLSTDICRALLLPREITVNVHFVEPECPGCDDWDCPCDEGEDECDE